MTGIRAGAGAADFDFLHGSWSVRHRKLGRPLEGDDTWLEFGGTMTARPILAGAGNFDENVINDPAGTYEACTVRLFDAASAEWSIFWIDGRDPTPDPPMIGAFTGVEGSFHGADTLRGKAILVRFLWSGTDGSSPRWEQAFSDDGGRNWETNWTMDFVRVDPTEEDVT